MVHCFIFNGINVIICSLILSSGAMRNDRADCSDTHDDQMRHSGKVAMLNNL